MYESLQMCIELYDSLHKSSYLYDSLHKSSYLYDSLHQSGVLNCMIPTPAQYIELFLFPGAECCVQPEPGGRAWSWPPPQPCTGAPPRGCSPRGSVDILLHRLTWPSHTYSRRSSLKATTHRYCSLLWMFHDICFEENKFAL